jgi:hypothetical protein
VTREQAEWVVNELVYAVTDYEHYRNKYYRAQLDDVIEKVIGILMSHQPTEEQK